MIFFVFLSKVIIQDLMLDKNGEQVYFWFQNWMMVIKAQFGKKRDKVTA